MTGRRTRVGQQTARPGRATRVVLAAALAAAAAALTGCASTVDTVDPADYINRTDDGMYRIQEPYPNPNAPAGVKYPDSCKSPPSMMGQPEGC